MAGERHDHLVSCESELVLGQQLSGLHSSKVGNLLSNTLSMYSKPDDLSNKDPMLAYAILEKVKVPTGNQQLKKPLKLYNTADRRSHTCMGGVASQPTTHRHESLKISQSTELASTCIGLSQDLTCTPSGSLKFSQSFVPPSPCTGLAQDLTNNPGAPVRNSRSVMSASTWTIVSQVMDDSLDHGFLHSKGGINEPTDMRAAQCQNSNETPNATHGRAGKITTLIIRNIPISCTATMLMDELHSKGFQGVYNFLYRPVDQQTGYRRSCAFVNFATPVIATAFYLRMHGKFLESAHDQGVPLEVLASQEQGLQSNAARYFTRKSKKTCRFRAKPIFLDCQNSRVLEVEAHARRMLLGDSTVLPGVGGTHRNPMVGTFCPTLQARPPSSSAS